MASSLTVRPETLAPERIERLEAGELVLLDQRRLPGEVVELRLRSWQGVADAIRTMAVRGAPAIGIAAAYGIAVAAAQSRAGSAGELRRELEAACDGLAATRPTAVNLAWAIGRMRRLLREGAGGREALAGALARAARALHADEVERCRLIGAHGAELLPRGGNVLTHCNAGALATGGYGTALGVIRAAHERGQHLHVWVDETRPLLQGARLTAWELQQEGVPSTLITDSMAGWLMAQGKVDAILTGADRIARNGDAANKIGTYGLSVLARAHGIPFYIAAPGSSIDASLESGDQIPIEHRDPGELTERAPAGFGAYNPAFDVTPAENITAIVSERGVHRPPYRFG